MANNSTLKDLCKKYNLHDTDTFKSPQGWTIIKRIGIDKIQAVANIDINYEIVEYTPAVSAAIKATANWNERVLCTFGETNTKNCKQSYVLAMAEKRAMSRIVLKLTGFYAIGVFGQDESEEFTDVNSNVNVDDNSNVNTDKKEYLSKDRFDNAIKAYKTDPDGVKKELRKYELRQDQKLNLKQNNIIL